MKLLGISINHRTSPIELREQLSLSDNEVIELIAELKKEMFSSGYVLSTCNRTEIFGFPMNGDITHDSIINRLLNFKKVDGIKDEHFKFYQSYEAVEHIMSVSSGLDSMMLGDSQILGQTKNAFRLAEESNFASPIMQRIFNTAIVAGKRAITETAIGEGATSISYAAVQLVEKIFSNFSRKKVLVIGAGETAELVITYLIEKETRDITVTNRTLVKARELADKKGLKTLEFNSFREHLADYDIIFSATSSDQPLVNYGDIHDAVKKRRGTPVCIIDIAIPRDFEPRVGDIENVFYNDIDSLNRIVESNLNKRKNEIPKVRKIISEEHEELQKWFNALQIVPTIKSLHGYFEQIRQDELRKIRNKLGDAEIDKIEDMTRRLLVRLLGPPTSKLREISEKSQQTEKAYTYSLLLHELFPFEK